MTKYYIFFTILFVGVPIGVIICHMSKKIAYAVFILMIWGRYAMIWHACGDFYNLAFVLRIWKGFL